MWLFNWLGIAFEGKLRAWNQRAGGTPLFMVEDLTVRYFRRCGRLAVPFDRDLLLGGRDK